MFDESMHPSRDTSNHLDSNASNTCQRLCLQAPWIAPGTVRDNILFGAVMDEPWYQAVLSACCLMSDLEGLPAGDDTELGEGGANLSGERPTAQRQHSCV